jgi:hypothetical protein
VQSDSEPANFQGLHCTAAQAGSLTGGQARASVKSMLEDSDTDRAGALKTVTLTVQGPTGFQAQALPRES